MKKKITLKTFNITYPDHAARISAVVGARTDNKIKIHEHFKILKDKNVIINARDLSQIHVLNDGPFETTKLSLQQIFNMTFELVSSNTGISALQLKKNHNVSYSTALTFLHSVRKHMHKSLTMRFTDSPVVLGISIPALESDINHRFLSIAEKKVEYILGISGLFNKKSRLMSISNDSEETLLTVVEKYIDRSCIIYTDDWFLAKHLKYSSQDYKIINDFPYLGKNPIKTLFGSLKRTIDYTYKGVSENFIQNYLNEVAFRYSYRNESDFGFKALLQSMNPLSNTYPWIYNH